MPTELSVPAIGCLGECSIRRRAIVGRGLGPHGDPHASRSQWGPMTRIRPRPHLNSVLNTLNKGVTTSGVLTLARDAAAT